MKQSLKPKSTGKTVVIVLLCLVIACLGGYILYDQLLREQPIEKKEDASKEKKEEALSVTSRLVQNLYSKVVPNTYKEKDKSWLRYWYYTDVSQSGNNVLKNALDDFHIEDTQEEIKMQLVGKNLPQQEREFITCSEVELQDELEDGRKSACFLQEQETNLSIPMQYQYGYQVETVDRIYQELFGQDKAVDRKVPIYLDIYGGTVLVYVESLSMYVEYFADGVGGTTGPGGYQASLSKAVKKGNLLKIYETVETYEASEDNEDTKLTDTTTLVYTFKLENDGMYTFQSREKDANA